MDKKTPGALLKLGIDEKRLTVERRREPHGDNETPLFDFFLSYPAFGGKQCLAVSLTGAVSSKKVTEEHKGQLSPDGNRTISAYT
jgi:hypothetical protein